MSDQTYYLIQKDDGADTQYLTSDGKFSANTYTAREFTKHQTASLYLKRLQSESNKPEELSLVEA